MRLARIKVSGYRKLVGAECTTPGKLIAFVGPNEAGKSSLLQALLSLRNQGEIPLADRPRALNVADDDAAIECWFRLEGADTEAIAPLGSPVVPTWYVLSKTYDGGLKHWLSPSPTRDFTSRMAAEQALLRFAQVRAAQELPRRADDDDEAELGDHLDAVREFIAGTAELTDVQLDTLRSLFRGLSARDVRGLALRARDRLEAWVVDAEKPEPSSPALDAMSKRRPRFALFGDEERTLKSDYTLTSVATDPPAALANLARVAGLDLPALAAAVERQDSGAYVTATEAANARLAEVFSEAWKQSPVVVRFHLDATILRVMVSNEGGGYSSIAERSDGLKAFVALTAFAAQEQASVRPLILLIDEAEQHLHFDAQADLVRMLDRQGLALQVLYTTHSPGCLPADLGTGIRPVVPAEGAGRSTVTNSFWTQDRGFYPLLMALGAGAAAFAPSRYAVLTEGASDMLLLPSMLREATGLPTLDYQVAPGVAESTWSQLLALDLAAPRVVYLIDGDAGGAQHAKRLTAAGVEANRIVYLGGQGSGLGPEDLLREDVYLAAVNEVLERVHGASAGKLKASDLVAGQRPAAVAQWCEARRLTVPAKTVVASIILEQAAPSMLTLASRKILRAVHTSLCSGLGVPSS
jgi:predicted ATP-dependent endonuclease of OLD family